MQAPVGQARRVPPDVLLGEDMPNYRVPGSAVEPVRNPGRGALVGFPGTRAGTGPRPGFGPGVRFQGRPVTLSAG
ncbi:hypothetical protein GCM10028775_72380 [Catellatospora paridis]